MVDYSTNIENELRFALKSIALYFEADCVVF